VIRAGQITVSSAVVTGLIDTYDLDTGEFIYGDGIPVETKILSIDSNTQITMDKNATQTGVVSLDISPDEVGVYHERYCAMVDNKAIKDERGSKVLFSIREEENVSRGRYDSIIQRSQGTPADIKQFFSCWPVIFNPSPQQLEAAGLDGKAEVLITTAKLDWNNLGIDYKEIDLTRYTVKVRGQTYKIRDKSLSSPFGEDYLDINFGLSIQ
jgi:hypothetical protein